MSSNYYNYYSNIKKIILWGKNKMWFFEKTDFGYKLICKNKKNSLNFTLPYVYQNKDILMYWTDDKIIKLINDLNSGKIPVNVNIESQNDIMGLKISFNISKNYDNYSF